MKKIYLSIFIISIINWMPMLAYFLVLNSIILRSDFILIYMLFMIINIPINIFSLIIAIYGIFNKEINIYIFICYLIITLAYILFGYPIIAGYSKVF